MFKYRVEVVNALLGNVRSAFFGQSHYDVIINGAICYGMSKYKYLRVNTKVEGRNSDQGQIRAPVVQCYAFPFLLSEHPKRSIEE